MESHIGKHGLIIAVTWIGATVADHTLAQADADELAKQLATALYVHLALSKVNSWPMHRLGDPASGFVAAFCIQRVDLLSA